MSLPALQVLTSNRLAYGLLISVAAMSFAGCTPEFLPGNFLTLETVLHDSGLACIEVSESASAYSEGNLDKGLLGSVENCNKAEALAKQKLTVITHNPQNASSVLQAFWILKFAGHPDTTYRTFNGRKATTRNSDLLPSEWLTSRYTFIEQQAPQIYVFDEEECFEAGRQNMKKFLPIGYPMPSFPKKTLDFKAYFHEHPGEVTSNPRKGDVVVCDTTYQSLLMASVLVHEIQHALTVHRTPGSDFFSLDPKTAGAYNTTSALNAWMLRRLNPRLIENNIAYVRNYSEVIPYNRAIFCQHVLHPNHIRKMKQTRASLYIPNVHKDEVYQRADNEILSPVRGSDDYLTIPELTLMDQPWPFLVMDEGSPLRGGLSPPISGGQFPLSGGLSPTREPIQPLSNSGGAMKMGGGIYTPPPSICGSLPPLPDLSCDTPLSYNQYLNLHPELRLTTTETACYYEHHVQYEVALRIQCQNLSTPSPFPLEYPRPDIIDNLVQGGDPCINGMIYPVLTFKLLNPPVPSEQSAYSNITDIWMEYY